MSPGQQPETSESGGTGTVTPSSILVLELLSVLRVYKYAHMSLDKS